MFTATQRRTQRCRHDNKQTISDKIQIMSNEWFSSLTHFMKLDFFYTPDTILF